MEIMTPQAAGGCIRQCGCLLCFRVFFYQWMRLPLVYACPGCAQTYIQSGYSGWQWVKWVTNTEGNNVIYDKFLKGTVT